MLKAEYYQKMREIEEANIKLERELVAERQSNNNTRASENMISELTRSYEERLTDVKKLSKKAVDESVRALD